MESLVGDTQQESSCLIDASSQMQHSMDIQYSMGSSVKQAEHAQSLASCTRKGLSQIYITATVPSNTRHPKQHLVTFTVIYV